ncbi:hypothetical protein CPT_Mater92 [Bacillus phage Mater]|uniref:Uncharacterized protein n=1 Tax=Bacillus phage Mater TaxID=1540090 RepID=A0A0A0RNN0_9CAUD|nr:HNH endonuclease [Bacillus phage Mater]AIW03249.1 hypothetical protein CPT_Mater92 [Bacillus phage Mater]
MVTVGTKRLNNYGSEMVVVEYNNWKDMVVEFKEGYRVRVNLSNFNRGEVKNVYDRTIYRTGFTGEGPFKSYDENHKATAEYKTWKQMLRRCYDKAHQEKWPTYIGCEVSEKWHNFQTFAAWYNENIYNASETVCLDKDILIKGNKVYSPDTCIFVPERINLLFVKSNRTRGDLPIGVVFDKSRGKYAAKFRYQGQTKNLGRFTTVEEAFLAYQTAKEKYIKETANQYKEFIPERLYNALIAYKVDITD